jgi:hypothetical protein
MVSIPIPGKFSKTHYADIHWNEYSLGTIVSDLTNSRVKPSHFAHLDPDLSEESLSRLPGWRPLFGTTSSAQGHLRNNGIQEGDIFLFFGLFRNVKKYNGRFVWEKNSPRRHVLWGWLQIDKAHKIDHCNLKEFEWALYHPHFNRPLDANNTIYIGKKYLDLPGKSSGVQAGAGVFSRFSINRVLSAPTSASPCQWELPEWFYPYDDKTPLTYHSNLTRWQKTNNGTILNLVARGQEFILNVDDYPEAIGWIRGILAAE